MIKVSIIVPVYNTAKFLRKCLDSLVNQTLSEIEIIIIDDGSTDGTPFIIEQYTNQYPGIIKRFTKKNGGAASARNLGIRKSNGEFIGFVDSDDYVNTQMYEIMYRKAVAADADMIECNYRHIKLQKNKEKEISTYSHVRKCDNQKEMFLNPLVSPWNKLYRTEILKNSKVEFPEGYIFEDTSFYVKVIPYLRKTEFVDNILVTHILREDSVMTSSHFKKNGDIFPVLQDAITWFFETNYYDTYKMELEYFCIKILLCSSLERISRVNDRNIRNQLIIRTLNMINDNFSEYRNNPYFKQGIKNLYMKTVNKHTILLYTYLFLILKINHGKALG